MLASTLAGHSEISAFHDTGVAEDEGQHLQNVYPVVRSHGGPGRFAQHPDAHLTEISPLATAQSARTLMRQWGPHWDLTRTVLLEKSPPNLIQGRFLQALFRHCSFVMILRHPLVVSLATQNKAKHQSLSSLLEHWFAAHRLLEQDAAHLERLLVVRYEALASDPDASVARIADFLGLEPALPSVVLDPRVTQRYQDLWSRRCRSVGGRVRKARLMRRYEAKANHFGYTLSDLDSHQRVGLDRA